MSLFKPVGELPEAGGEERMGDRGEEDERGPEVKRFHLDAVPENVPYARELGIVIVFQWWRKRDMVAFPIMRRPGGRCRDAEQQ